MPEIAVDFGGTNIKIGIVDSGEIIAKASLPAFSADGLVPRLPHVERTVHGLLNQLDLSTSDCTGIGIAMPGIVNPTQAKVLSIHARYADAMEFSFTDWASDAFNLPCILENDAKAALFGEVTYGVARGATDIVSMIFGTGIGTAAMIDGRLVRGVHHQAGCLGGHFTVDVHGRQCTCGNIGCVEAEASHMVLSEIVKGRAGFKASILSKSETVDYLSVIEAVRGGDAFAQDVLSDLLTHWAAGIVNLVHAYDPSVILLCGALMQSADVFLDKLAQMVRQHTWTPWGEVDFLVAHHPDSSVLLGLSALARK